MAYVDAKIMATAKKFHRQLKDQGIHVKFAYLFGFYSKGVPDEWSDIDIAIVSRDISEDRVEERIRLTRLPSRFQN